MGLTLQGILTWLFRWGLRILHTCTFGQELWGSVGAGVGLFGIIHAIETHPEEGIVTSYFTFLTIPMGLLISVGAAIYTLERTIAEYRILMLVMLNTAQFMIYYHVGCGKYLSRQTLETWAYRLEGGTLKELSQYEKYSDMRKKMTQHDRLV